MSAVVYDVGYDTRLIKTRKNMVTDNHQYSSVGGRLYEVNK